MTQWSGHATDVLFVVRRMAVLPLSRIALLSSPPPDCLPSLVPHRTHAFFWGEGSAETFEALR